MRFFVQAGICYYACLRMLDNGQRDATNPKLERPRNLPHTRICGVTDVSLLDFDAVEKRKTLKRRPERRQVQKAFAVCFNTRGKELCLGPFNKPFTGALLTEPKHLLFSTAFDSFLQIRFSNLAQVSSSKYGWKAREVW